MKNLISWLNKPSSTADDSMYPEFFYWDFPMLKFDLFPNLHEEYKIGKFDSNLQSALKGNMDLIEYENRFMMEAEVPGLTKDDVKLELEGDILTISAEKKEQKERKNGRILSRGKSFLSFKKRFVLGSEIDIENVEAHVKNGILFINLPKLEKETRKIEVK